MASSTTIVKGKVGGDEIAARDGNYELEMKIRNLKFTSACLACFTLAFQVAVILELVIMAQPTVFTTSFWSGLWAEFKTDTPTGTARETFGGFLFVVSLIIAFQLVHLAWLFSLREMTASFTPCTRRSFLTSLRILPWDHYSGHAKALFIAATLNVFHATLGYMLSKEHVPKWWGTGGGAFLTLATVHILALAAVLQRIGYLEKISTSQTFPIGNGCLFQV